MDKTIAENVKEFASDVGNFLPEAKVLIYGSFARNEANEQSDIDVAVIVEDTEDSFLHVSAQLWQISSRIDPRIEPKLIRTQHTRSGIYETVLREGIVAR